MAADQAQDARHAARIPLVFCGHTHRAREANVQGMHGINIGWDYRFKRMMTVEWPDLSIETHQFGSEER